MSQAGFVLQLQKPPSVINKTQVFIILYQKYCSPVERSDLRQGRTKTRRKKRSVR